MGVLPIEGEDTDAQLSTCSSASVNYNFVIFLCSCVQSCGLCGFELECL